MAKVRAAATITVNSIADTTANDGFCTLREAITAANNDAASGVDAGECAAGSGTDIIEFGISGSGVHTIQPGSALPTITQPVTINGYTQTAATENTNESPNTLNGVLKIEIDGTNAGAVHGLSITADNVTIRGVIINRFEASGIYLNGTDSAVITGNYIGVSSSGTTDLGNGGNGVMIFNSTNLMIGGFTESDRNVISGNGDNGVYMQDNTTDAVFVLGNFIGLASDGTAMGNDSHGVDVIGGPTDVQIGGEIISERNVISGNDQQGVYIDSTNNVRILGNNIGTNPSGTAAIANGEHGIMILNGSADTEIGATNNVTVGGACTGACNLISGNTRKGIDLEGGDGTIIEGNYIGTDASGTGAVPNAGAAGIGIVTGDNTTIGGTTSGSRNVISGNTGCGVIIASNNSTVYGNYLGVDTTGDNPLSNASGSDVNLLITGGGDDNIIGGPSSAKRNVISGTSAIQVRILGATPFGASTTTGNKVQGNYIGTDASGNIGSGFGSAGEAVSLAIDAQNNLIGGISSGEGNVIAGNGGGVAVSNFASYEATNNSILGNSIYDNDGGAGATTLGIDLMGVTNDGTTFTSGGVTPNDAGDTDTESNQLINFPVVSSISSSNGKATITYSLDINDAESGATGYRVEFFANNNADSSGHGQGQTFIGSDTISGDVTDRSVTIDLPEGVSGSKYISSTTTMTDNSTDGFANTSEFSENVQATLEASIANSNNNNSLADTGQNTYSIYLLSIVLFVSGSVVFLKNKNYR